jgi:Ca2+-binding RTX toxin-like protein
MVYANQSELSPVPCVEGQEPLQLDYGQHTTGCAIGREGRDYDRFSFDGVIGDHIRVIVRSKGDLAQRLEIYDGNDLLTDRGCNFCSSLSVDVSLPRSGTYLLTLSDNNFSNTGEYEITLECPIGRCPATPPIFCRGLRATIVGGERDNTLIGTADADVIVGLGGNDIISVLAAMT